MQIYSNALSAQRHSSLALGSNSDAKNSIGLANNFEIKNITTELHFQLNEKRLNRIFVVHFWKKLLQNMVGQFSDRRILGNQQKRPLKENGKDITEANLVCVLEEICYLKKELKKNVFIDRVGFGGFCYGW